MTIRVRRKVLQAGTSWQRVVLGYCLLGAVLGIILLHPLTMIIYWQDLHDHPATTAKTIIEFVVVRTTHSFTPPMLPMTASFALMGMIVGLLFARLHLLLVSGLYEISLLEKELAQGIPALIRAGEGAHTEFKSTARWDVRQDKLNKAMERQIVKTIAAFSNHEGGNLIVGVDDDGDAVGLEMGYQTLRKKTETVLKSG